MQIIRTLSELKSFQKIQKISGEKLVFIPTMGALHDGHLSLVEEGKEMLTIQKISGKILVSLFVNPTQFDNADDLKKYPKTGEKDIQKLKNCGLVDAVFIPDILEIYPENRSLHSLINQKNGGQNSDLDFPIYQKKEEDILLRHDQQPEKITLPPLFSELEGATRKGHFEGVFQVVHRLFSLVQPDFSVFGQKDFQQVLLIQYLQKKFFPEISLLVAPIFREKNGLAFSSRNMRFSPKEKNRAVILFETLSEISHKVSQQKITKSEAEKISRTLLSAEKFLEKIHYIAFRTPENFSEISGEEFLKKGDVMLLSVQFAGVHLIDNIIL